MNRYSLFALTTLASALLVGTATATPTLDMKPGAWSMTMTMVTQGSMIPKEALAQMPPDRRAKIEATMKARAGKPSTQAYEECITQQDIDKIHLLKSDEENCTQKLVSQSANHVVIERTCAPPEASKGKVVIDTPNPQQIRMSIDITRLDGSDSATVHSEINGHWTGATCTHEE